METDRYFHLNKKVKVAEYVVVVVLVGSNVFLSSHPLTALPKPEEGTIPKKARDQKNTL